MNKPNLLLLFAFLTASAGAEAITKGYESGVVIIDGERQRPTFPTQSFEPDMEAYMLNVGSGQFFTQGNSWAVQASVGSEPRMVKFQTNSDYDYTMLCYCWRNESDPGGFFPADWRNVFFGSEYALFVDRYTQADYFFAVESNGETFRISTSPNNPTFSQYYGTGAYVGLPKNSTITTLSPFVNEIEAYVDWAFVSIEDYEALSGAIALYNKAQELKVWIDRIEAQNGDASSLKSVYLNEEASMEELQAAIDSAQPVYIKAVISNATDKENVDVSLALVNPNYDDGETGWTVEAAPGDGPNGRQGNVRPGGSSSNLCYEAWNNKSFDIYQKLTDMPVGVYEIEVQGFYRYGRGETAWNAYVNQNVDYVKPTGVPVYIYLNNNATNFVNVFGDEKQITDASFYSNGSDDYSSHSRGGTTYYFPDGMASAAIAFSDGMYKQSAFGLIANEGDEFRIGVKGNSNQLNDSWVIWDNFKLYYRGFKAEVVKPVLEAAIADLQQYSSLLMGKTEFATLSTAFADAQTVIENNDGEAMFRALNALYDVKDAVIASKDIFIEQDVVADTLRLAEAIRSMSDKKLAQTTLEEACELLNGIKGNTLYENYEIDMLKNDVTVEIETLWESVALYEQFSNAIRRLSDVIENEFSQQTYIPETLITQAGQELAKYSEQYEKGEVDDADVEMTITKIDELAGSLKDIIENYITPADWAILKAVWQQMNNGEDWKQNWSFETDTPSKKLLPGVTVDNGNVTAINLTDNNLSGEFPYALLSLPYLQDLYVSYNNLTGDMGKGLQEYVSQHPASGKSLKRLNISSNKLEGNIGLVASLLPSLTDLYASMNCFSEVSPMIDRAVNISLTEQRLDCEIDLNLKGMTAASVANQLPPIVLYNHNRQTFGPDVRLWVYNANDECHLEMYLMGIECSEESTGKLLFSGGQIGTIGAGVFRGMSGDLHSVYNIGDNVPWNCNFTARLTFDEGDGNFDGNVDILDLQSMILYIMEDLGNYPYNFTASNLWQDDMINVQDIICLVNLLMDTDSEPSSVRRKAPSQEIGSDASVYVQNGQILLKTPKPVAAIDLRLNSANIFNGGKDLESMGMTFVTRKKADGLHIIAYAMNGSYIPAGTSVIGTIDNKNAVICHVMLSDPKANFISATKNTGTTGIVSISPIKEDNGVIYDLQGRKVNDELRKGLYIKNGHIIIK